MVIEDKAYDKSQCYLPEHGFCCCECRFRHPLMSHPWVDGNKMSHQTGWICLMPEFNGKAILTLRHGGCECFSR